MSERRSFLKQLGSGLGGFMVSPKAGVLGLLAGAMAGRSLKEAPQAAPSGGALSGPKLLLRSGDPINSQGHAFGGEISSLEMVGVPGVSERSRKLLVVGHAADGITVLELFGEEGAWRHDLSSMRNRRYRSIETVSMVSATVDQDAAGPGAVSELFVTPWDTVLVATETLFELDPRLGTIVRLADFDNLSPRGLELRAVSGAEARLVFTCETSDQRLCFETSQKYSAREIAEAKRILRSGSLKEMPATKPAAALRPLSINGISARVIDESGWGLWLN